MKKITFSLIIMILLLSPFQSAVIAAEKNATPITTNTEEIPAEVKIMYNRLEEIKAMDKSSMTFSEKKALRKEVRTIKANL